VVRPDSCLSSDLLSFSIIRYYIPRLPVGIPLIITPLILLLPGWAQTNCRRPVGVRAPPPISHIPCTDPSSGSEIRTDFLPTLQAFGFCFLIGTRCVKPRSCIVSYSSSPPLFASDSEKYPDRTGPTTLVLLVAHPSCVESHLYCVWMSALVLADIII